MKRIIITLCLFIITIQFSACGKADSNTLNYDAIYNSEADVMIQLGESAQSVNAKFDVSQYNVIDKANDRYTYEFTEKGGMKFTINFTNDQVNGFGFVPQSQSFNDELVDDFFNALACDWKWMGDIGLMATEETVKEKIGPPSWQDTNESATQYAYAFASDLSLISAADYNKSLEDSAKDTAIYKVDVFFFEGKLFSLGVTAVNEG